MKPHIRMALLGIILAFAFGRGIAQVQPQESDIQFRLAQSYERSGDIEAAAKIYEQLYEKNPSNVIFFDALRRSYMQLKKYPETVALINKQLAMQPQDMTLLAQLGRVYSFLSDDAKANDAWDRAIAIAPKNDATYRIVASSMLESRLFDKAIQVYLRGRKTLGNPTLYASDLAYLYSSVLNYPEATREYLNVLKDDPNQFSLVQSRIAGYTGRPDGLAAAVKVVEDRSHAEPENLTLLELLSWLAMEGRQYDVAFDIERRIDEKMKSGGMQVYAFAERALREHAIGAAAKAFQEVITKYPSFTMMPQAKFGYARTLEDSSAQQDTFHLFRGGNVLPGQPVSEAEPAFRGTIAAYRGIVDEYPNTEIAARSLLQMARLMYDRFFNLDESRRALETIVKQYKNFIPIVMEAELLSGDVALADGDLSKAENAYNAVLNFRTVGRDMQEKATFALAQLAYFRGDFGNAVKALQGLTKNAGANITNDALALLLFVQENQQADSTALTAYAHADLLAHQRKLSEALTADEAIHKTYASTPLIDETLMNIGDLLAEMGRYPEAIASYDSLIAGFPESIVLDRAFMKVARIYEAGMKDKAKAIDTYQQLLIKYPNSIYSSEARKQIRVLRGDTL